LWVGEPQSRPEDEPAGEEKLPDWLQSLRRPGEEEETPAPSSNKRESLPDWLSGLRSQGEEEAQPEDAAPSQPPKDDWLGSILGESGYDAADEPSDSPQAQDYEGASADWLDRIGSEDTLSQSAPTQKRGNEFAGLVDRASWDEPVTKDELPEGGELPDWLRSASPAPQETPDELHEWLDDQSTEKFDTPDELPDWLNNLPANRRDEPADLPAWLTPSQPPASSADTPEWLPGQAIPPEVPSAQEQPADRLQAAPVDDIPDWLKSQPQAAEPTFESQPEDLDWLHAAPSDELPDWLKGSPQAAETSSEPQPEDLDWLQAAPADDVPEWLKGAQAEADTLAGAAAPHLPDWLSGQASSNTLPVELPGAPIQPASADAMPDFLHDLEPGAAETPQAETPDADIPDWLKGVPAASSDLPDFVASQPSQPEPAEDVPDWLKGVPAASADLPDFVASQASQPEPADDVPDWLKDVSSASADVQDVTASAQPLETPSGEVPDWLQGQTPAESSIDWMGATPAAAAPQAEEDWMAGDNLDWLSDESTGQAPSEPAVPGGQMPDWMVGMAGGLAASGKPDSPDLSWLGDASAYSSDEPPSGEAPPTRQIPAPDKALPDWLGQAEESISASPASSSAQEGDLKAGELPSWLQAMRPVGVVGAAAEEKNEVVAIAGPLSGLPGLLPAEAHAMRAGKPPVYSSRLNVSDAHQLSSELLTRLVESEALNAPLPGRPAITSLAVLRVAMAFLLILPVVLSLWTGFPNTGVPFYTPEIKAAMDAMNALPQGAAVLLAVDYEPGLSGEMDTLTGAVVQHLVGRGAYLTLVSTTPTGPNQAENMLALARTQRGVLLPPNSYTNLGLIPGGAAGLRAFAANPRSLLPVDVRGAPAWQNVPLNGVQMAAQFQMLLLATDNPETARAWLEQVQPALAGVTPMVVLTSAQSEVFIRPYYESGQAQGLVSGLMGGAALEHAAGLSGQAARYWTPFSVGMLVAAALMLMGGLYNLAMGRISRRKTSSSGEAKL
jgi:hypothetical protein